ncbi:trypsin-like peptidase domain-containing protein [Mucilaginibacter lappiensis]|jgi:hypothetical protein|uniref:trypsin-like peptidase domain-containing protein n=1 Tax=Mucilaginibacter lappiensis TaxID=354630 RepID=UPI003D1A2BB2
MALLTQQEIGELVTALSSGMDTMANRMVLWQFIDSRYRSIVPYLATPLGQLMSDVQNMNQTERLANGEVPLQIYLQNALPFLFGSPKDEKIVRITLDLIATRSSGAPTLDITELPETKEQIIHSDDMVTFGFMEAGLKAASSVVKLKVKSYSAGQPRTLSNGNDMIFLGTGWVLANELIITNHHVINARKDNEQKASEADLKLQARNTEAILDFDSEDMPSGATVMALKLEAWDESLDYAILRVAPTGRTPLKLSSTIVNYSGQPYPVNIIQHPGGRSKRYGIRNNLVSASTATDLRYFTDTEGGSSGSPVFNDAWNVIALHKSSLFVTNVQFQGKATAYVNAGTHINLIADHLKQNFPEIAVEAGIKTASI